MTRWSRKRGSVLRAARTEWEALGVAGRLALLGLVASLVVAGFLGVGIPAAVEDDLISSHLESLSREIEALVQRGTVSPDGVVLDERAFVDHWDGKTIGGTVVGVNVWGPGGTIEFSSESGSEPYGPASERWLSLAFEGEPAGGHVVGVSGSRRHLWDFCIPLDGGSGEVVAVIQIFEETPTLHEGLASIRRWLWLGLALGLAALFVFDVVVVAANTRELGRRRDEAEALVAELAIAQEAERARIVGALHDDIGQPLYRVLYGIEGVRARLGDDHPLSPELAGIGDVLRSVDGTLRAELQMLHQGALDQLDLDTLLSRLAADVRADGRLEVTLTANDHGSLSDASRAALFRAAREAVANVRRHSGATALGISVDGGRSVVAVQVDDDGTGFDGLPGLGLTAVRTGLEAVGGGLHLERRPGGGTRFRAWAPRQREPG